MFQLILANPSHGLELGHNTTGKTQKRAFSYYEAFVFVSRSIRY